MTRTNLALILIASAAGAVAGAITTSLLAPAPSAQSFAATAGDARLAEVEKQQADLERAVSELRASQALLAERSQRSLPAAEPASVAKPADDGATGALAGAPEAKGAAADLDVGSALALLDDPNASYSERGEVWERVKRAGLLDAVVAAVEKRAEREPNNPDLRVDVGNAYLQQLFAGSMAMRGVWGTKADKAFDAALELDPQHWEARFTKAVALSNWPAFTGKQAMAITEFETLVKQQEAGPKKDEHAQTWLYLGNMYQASGSQAKALEAWQKGLGLFPDNKALQAQIAAAGHH